MRTRLLIMNGRLLNTSIKILRLFLREKIVKENIMEQISLPTPETIEKIGLASNEIIDIISPDRSHVIAAIHVLIKEKFLRQRKKWKQGYSKKIRPTALGFEVLKLIEDTSTFDKSNRDLFSNKNLAE